MKEVVEEGAEKEEWGQVILCMCGLIMCRGKGDVLEYDDAYR